MKKIALISAATLLAASTVAFADDMDMNQHNGTGFYAGADIGYVQAQTKADGDDTGVSKVTPRGIRGGIFAGYGIRMDNNFYIGAEGKFSMSNAKRTKNIDNVAIDSDTSSGEAIGTIADTWKQKESFSLAVRPGYYVTDNTLLYGNIGWVNTKFENDVNFTGQDVFIPSEKVTKSLSDSSNVNGLQLGVGVQQNFTQNLGVRAEYLHDFYQKKDGFDYSSDEVNVGLVWTIN